MSPCLAEPASGPGPSSGPGPPPAATLHRPDASRPFSVRYSLSSLRKCDPRGTLACRSAWRAAAGMLAGSPGVLAPACLTHDGLQAPPFSHVYCMLARLTIAWQPLLQAVHSAYRLSVTTVHDSS